MIAARSITHQPTPFAPFTRSAPSLVPLKPHLLRFLLLLPLAASAATRVELSGDRAIPALAFSAAEIERAAALAPAGAPLFVSLEIEPAAGLDPQAYRLERSAPDRVRVVGGGAPGAMYGGLDIAEAIRTGTLDTLRDSDHKPHIAQRGIKFNIPLDPRFVARVRWRCLTRTATSLSTRRRCVTSPTPSRTGKNTPPCAMLTTSPPSTIASASWTSRR